MKWTVALFGHFKDIPLKQDDPVEHAAAIKRAQPGDVIAFKPWEDRNIWTPNERSEFLIVTIDGPTSEQMDALLEQEFDLTSYEVLNAEKTNYEQCRFPRDYTNKRRFIIDLTDLAAKGVDIDRMVDRSDQYDPQPEFTHLEIYDRVKKNKVKVTDELKRIKSRTDQEIDNAQGQQGEG